MAKTVDVQIGPAIVEFGDTQPTIFDITKGGIVFSVETEVHDVTVDQFGGTPIKSILRGRNAQATVPMAEYDLEKLGAVMPDSDFVEDATDPNKKKLVVKANAGFDLMGLAKKLVIKPTDETATANDWITIPLAGPMADIEATFDSENERIYTVTFKAYVDREKKNQLFILGDDTASESSGGGGGGE